MSKLIASALLVSILLLGAEPAAASDEARLCPGLSVAGLEQRFPKPVEALRPRAGDARPAGRALAVRPAPAALPMRPERVTVYACRRPVVIGFMSGDCVIALLRSSRQRFLRWLRPQLGWSI